MASTKLLVGGAAATAALGVRVARSLYGRWHVPPEPERRRIENLAEDPKHKAVELRGASDAESVNEDLRAANATLAAALAAEANPGVSENEVRELRDDLRRELERLAGADIKASRTRRGSPSPG
jgi:multidrug resistance efflux pump